MKPVVVLDKIMETANRLFFEQGYNLTGINQIIEEAGISKPSLYNHFNSKNDLLLAYLDKMYISWFEGLDDFSKELTDPLDRLIALFDYRISRQIKLDYGGCPWIKISAEVPRTEIEVHKRALKFKNDFKDYVFELVKQINRPKDRLLNDEQFAETVFLQLEGGLIITQITQSYQSLENAKDIIRKLV